MYTYMVGTPAKKVIPPSEIVLRTVSVSHRAKNVSVPPAWIASRLGMIIA